MKYILRALVLSASLVRISIGVAETAGNFDATTEIVGWKTNTFETPVNQRITPAGIFVPLPEVRPNDLALSPDGRLLVTSGLKHELIVMSPADGKILQTVKLPANSDTANAEAVSAQILKANLRDKLSYTGLIFSPDGKKIYLSNVNGDIKVFSVDKDSIVSPAKVISLPSLTSGDRKKDIPSGIALSPDGKKLYVTLSIANRVAEINTDTGTLLRSWDVGVAPFSVTLSNKKLYVSNWGGRRPDAHAAVGPIGRTGPVRVNAHSVAAEGSVAIIDLQATDAQPKLELLTGPHASAIAATPNGKFIVCANSGADTLSVIDTRTDQIVETICVRQNPGDPFGAQPDALAFDQRGKTLFVCNGSQNAVAVIQFQPGNSKLLGLIPVGWFPAAVIYDQRRGQLDVANIMGVSPAKLSVPDNKGVGEGFNSHQYYGSLSLVKRPSAKQLDAFTRLALADLRYPLLAQSKLPARPGRKPQPVPERVGEPSVFEHVFYIIKENRTYDQVLGDIKEGDGNADLCIFGEHITPNQHQIARDFVLLDNTYCSGIQSAEGHQWTDSAIANDYIQRSYAGWPRSYPYAGGSENGFDALAYASSGFIWNDALEHGKTVRDYGEFTNPHHYWKATHKPQSGWLEGYRDFTSGSNAVGYYAEVGLESLRPFIDTNVLGFDVGVADVIRVASFKKDFQKFEQAGQLPNLIILCLPDDHTTGTKYGAPTPEAQVADNDLAFGQVAEIISHSRFWSNSCIVAIEDDPQDGWDHVSGYRTTAYVISPYTKRHATIHTQYNQTSLLRTIELMLGLPPMNQMDATATPMFECFTETPDFRPYVTLTNQVPLDKMNPKPKEIKDAALRRDAYISARLPWDKEDQCPEDLFNHILWRAAKGSRVPYPAWAVKAGDED